MPKRKWKTALIALGILAIVSYKWTLVTHFVTNTRWNRTFQVVR